MQLMDDDHGVARSRLRSVQDSCVPIFLFIKRMAMRTSTTRRMDTVLAENIDASGAHSRHTVTCLARLWYPGRHGI